MGPLFSSLPFGDGFIIGSKPTRYSETVEAKWKSDATRVYTSPEIVAAVWKWSAAISEIPGFAKPGKVHTVGRGVTLKVVE